MASLEEQVGPVRRGKRSAVLLDGKAHAQLVRLINAGSIDRFVTSLPARLVLVKAERLDSWGAEDANYLVIDRELLLERIRNDIGETVVVDVTSDQAPRVISRDHQVYDRLKHSFAAIGASLSSSSETRIPGSATFTKGQLDSVLLGWLLEYPCLYYSESQDRNCLNDEALRLVSIAEVEESAAFTSFSVPVRLLKDPLIAHALKDAKNKYLSRGLVWNETTVCFPKLSL